ncbi:MAG TPA: TonB-dependent receptor [Terriglobia bacterium]
MKRLYLTFILTLILFVTSATAQQTGRLTGSAVDSSGGVIRGATVTLMGPNNNTIASSKTDADGKFQLDAAPGSYALQVSADGFDNDIEGISIAAANNRPMTVTLLIAKITQQVEVQENPNTISLAQDDNASALVLKEDDIQALPDDVDELTQYLTDLAGPRAAATGGVQFVIDGFLGGQLPPKDQIKEIRINNNPFTTEYAQAGFGRIEIITKPGTGKMRGNFNFNFRNDAMNAIPFGVDNRVPYHRENYQATVAGPFVHDKLTMTLNAQRNNNFGTAVTAPIDLATGLTNSVQIAQPNVRSNFNIRGQYAVNDNNMLNFNLELQSQARSNQGVGLYDLVDNGYSSNSHNWGLHFRYTSVLSSHLVHETRFELSSNHNTVVPNINAPTISILDAYTAGGSQNQSNTTTKNWLAGDTFIYNAKSLTVKTGFQANYYRNHTNTLSNSLGTFTYASLQQYNCVNGIATVNPCLASDPTTTGFIDDFAPQTYTQTVGNPLLSVGQIEAGVFAQTDIKISDKMLISPGVRYALQTHLHNYDNFDPRATLSYQLNKTMILRLGAGSFHQNYSVGTYQSLTQSNGSNQTQFVVNNPTLINPLGAGTAKAAPPTVRVVAPELRAPYTSNLSVSLEKQLSRSSVSVTYDFIRGNHLFRSRNINAPIPTDCFANPGQCSISDFANNTLVRPDPTQGNIYNLESTGNSTYKGITVGYRGPLTKTLNMFVNYSFARSYSDTNGAFSLPVNNYDLSQEWGRSGNDQRNHFQMGISGQIPGNFFISPQLQLYSGNPYNLTGGLNTFGTGTPNARPTFAQLCSDPRTVGLSGLNCSSPSSNMIPLNYATGPGVFNVNFEIRRTISLKKSEKGGAPGAEGFGGGFNGGGGGNQGGGNRGGGGGGRGGGGSFAGGGNRGGGGGGRGNANTGPTVQFYTDFQNVLNHRNFNTPSGTLTSPEFGLFKTARSQRTIELGARLNF